MRYGARHKRLSAIERRSQAIRCRGGHFTVRAISVGIIAELMSSPEGSEMFSVVDAIQTAIDASSSDGDAAALSRAVAEIASKLPALVAKAVALCADEPDAWKTVLRLPVPVLLDTLLTIGRLTFHDAAAVANLQTGINTIMSTAMRSNLLTRQAVATAAKLRKST
jgi:hypothetical protein